MKKLTKPLFIAALVLTLCPSLYAQQSGDMAASTSADAATQQLPSPLPLLQRVSNDMLKALKQNQASMKKDPSKVYEIVDSILLPHADLPAMARSALGRNAWMAASPDQQQAFIGAFTNLMIHTYAAGLSSYKDESVNFDPIRGGLTAEQNRTEVSSQIIRKDGPPIPMSYRLIYKKDPTTGKFDWYVYDFSVEGISVIQSFRSQFADEISGGMSIDTLTQKLNAHNTRVNGTTASSDNHSGQAASDSND